MKKILLMNALMMIALIASGQTYSTTIGELTQVSSLSATDALVIEQSDSTRKVLWSDLTSSFADSSDIYDSLAVHQDTLQAHNIRLLSLESGGVNPDSSYMQIQTDSIYELSSSVGVTIEGITIEDGVIASPSISGLITVGSAVIDETELEILDGATTTTTQINYLNAATGTTGTTNTNLVFSTSPTFTTSITLGSTAISETEIGILDDKTFETTIADDDTDIPSSGAVVDYAVPITGSVSGSTSVWLIADTVILGSSGLIDSCNTTWAYLIIDNHVGSDTLTISQAAYRARGSSMTMTMDIIQNDSLNPASAVQNDTIVAGWALSNVSGDAVNASAITNADIPPGNVAWFKFSAVTTEPDYLYVTLYGYRKNATY